MLRRGSGSGASPGSTAILCLLLATRCHGFATTRMLTNIPALRLPSAFVRQPLSLSSIINDNVLRSQSETRATNRPQASAASQLCALWDDLMERLPSQSVISAVEASSRSDGVIASDVAASAGISLAQAQKDLTALASLVQGDIAVSFDGELIYTFPVSVQAALLQNSAKYKALEAFRKVWPVVFWGIRVSFGVVLVASVVAIFATIFFISATGGGSSEGGGESRGGGERRRSSDGSGYNSGFGSSAFDSFSYRSYGSYGYYSAEQRRPGELGILESAFSYIFGDGNPNANIEELRLSMAAQVIRKNKGAVTAEQLAPFCDEAPTPPSDDEAAMYVDESYVLPIVTALSGAPQVTDDGDIIYVFDELQQTTTADDQQSAYRIVGQEKEIRFSRATYFNKVLAGGLGVVNLGGALYLGHQLSTAAMDGIELPAFYGAVESLYPALLGYAILYNIIPLLRNLWNRRENAKIQQRNSIRRRWQSKLEWAAWHPTTKLGRKLLAAREFGQETKRLSSTENIVFDTQQTMYELEAQKAQQAQAEFDKLLEQTIRLMDW